MTIIIPHFRQCIKIAAFRRENLWLLFSCGEAQNLPLSNLSCNSFICFLCRRLSIWLNSCCVFHIPKLLTKSILLLFSFFLTASTRFSRAWTAKVVRPEDLSLDFGSLCFSRILNPIRFWEWPAASSRNSRISAFSSLVVISYCIKFYFVSAPEILENFIHCKEAFHSLSFHFLC